MKVFILASASRSLYTFRSQLIMDFLEKGVQVSVCAPKLSEDVETNGWLQSLGVETNDAPFSRAGMNPLSDLMSFFKLKRIIKKVGPDIFLGYTIKPVVWGGLAACWERVDIRVALVTGLGYAFTGEASGKRKFVQILVRFLYKISLRSMHHIFFQNPDDKLDFERYNLAPKNVPMYIVNGSGVDTLQYVRKRKSALPLKFLLIGRLLGDKGIREYAGAAAIIKQRHPDVQFHLVGGLDSNPNALTEQEVTNWVNDRIIYWHGYQKDVRPFLSDCHVYVLPSYREGTPRSVLEAMSMQIPIITTDAPGCRETVIPGYNGYLVEVRSTIALVEAMEKFIKNPENIDSMGINSRKLAISKYDVHTVNKFMLSKILS